MSEPAMKTLILPAVWLLSGALAAGALQAQTETAAAPAAVSAVLSPVLTPVLTPVSGRISDRAINADLQTYEAMQASLKAINDAGRPLRDYHLAKAQCWLDVSFHEYSRNDRGPFPQDALGQAAELARGMAAGLPSGQPPLGYDTPQVSGAERLRPDLWAQAAALQRHTGLRCAQQKLACAEVELVHAGHEYVQLGWRHAKPYVQIAEDGLAEAQLLAERCDPPPAPVLAVVLPLPVPPLLPAPPAPPVPPPPVPRISLGASVVFNFDRDSDADMRPFSRAQLAALVQQIKAEGLVARTLQLTGHADRLNSTGQPDYNQQLSARRVATVRAALARLGLPGIESAAFSTEALGDGQPVQVCTGKFASRAELQECLLPNRRVELRVTAEPAPR